MWMVSIETLSHNHKNSNHQNRIHTFQISKDWSWRYSFGLCRPRIHFRTSMVMRVKRFFQPQISQGLRFDLMNYSHELQHWRNASAARTMMGPWDRCSVAPMLMELPGALGALGATAKSWVQSRQSRSVTASSWRHPLWAFSARHLPVSSVQYGLVWNASTHLLHCKDDRIHTHCLCNNHHPWMKRNGRGCIFCIANRGTGTAFGTGTQSPPSRSSPSLVATAAILIVVIAVITSPTPVCPLGAKVRDGCGENCCSQPMLFFHIRFTNMTE